MLVGLLAQNGPKERSKVASQKIDSLALGRGSLTDNSNAAIVFSSNNLVGYWDVSATYSQYNCLEYSGKMYRSKVNSNIGLQPDTNPNSWEVLYTGTKDGDVAVIIQGSSSTIYQRAANIWTGIGEVPLTITLVDGQATLADALVFVGSSKPFANIEYILQRTTGNGRKRKGDFNILNDGFSTVSYDHSFAEIGNDVNAWLSIVMESGSVKLKYTSGSEGVPLTLKYVLKGF